MTDFRIWGRIEHEGPDQFFVAVYSLAHGDGNAGDLKTSLEVNLQDAQAKRDDLVRKVNQQIVAAGHRVIDTEVE